eukprot:c57056_g1_i1 orf=3-173(-)
MLISFPFSTHHHEIIPQGFCERIILSMYFNTNLSACSLGDPTPNSPSSFPIVHSSHL